MNFTFIGMSGAGKSHIGKRYAAAHEMEFIDIDTEMEQEFGKPLQAILEELGEESFLQRQEEQVLKLGEIDDAVISPGGSVVYTKEAMEWLKEHSTIVFLDVPYEVIETRIEVTRRGIVGMGGKTLHELYDERHTLYEQWADVVVATTDNQLEAVEQVLAIF